MELNEKLEQLHEIILQDAFAQRDQKLNQLKQEKEDYLKRVREEIQADTARYLSEGTKKMEQEYKREKAAWEFERNCKILKKRLEIEEQVMAELRQKILVLTHAPEYEEHLNRLLDTVKSFGFSGETVALCGEKASVEKKVLQTRLPDVAFETDSTIEVGGFRLKDEKRQVMLDLTLDKRLEEARHLVFQVANLKG